MDISRAVEMLLGRSLAQDISLNIGLARAVHEAWDRATPDDDPDAVDAIRRWIAENKEN